MRTRTVSTARAFALAALFVAVLFGVISEGRDAQAASLEYVGRYDSDLVRPDHLMDVRAVNDTLAIIAGNLGLVLVDVRDLPSEGTHASLDVLGELNARDLRILDQRYVYAVLAHSHSVGGPGLAVVEIVDGVLHLRGIQTDPDAIYEKLALDGEYLYAAVHAHGLRVYSLADPLNPVEVGRLETGLTDAFAIHIVGDTAYVADGAGGLKLVDVSDPTAPVLLGGESLETATGTAEDVTARDGHVYVAAGGSGVAFFENGDVGSRTLYRVDAAARDIGWVEDRLVVDDLNGIRIYDVAPDGSLSLAARETVSRRGTNAQLLRIASGTASFGDLILSADWSAVDVYRVADDGAASQPDIALSVPRIRFAPDGGTTSVTVHNPGSADLHIADVVPSVSSFSSTYSGGTIAPGDSVVFNVSYDGDPEGGTGLIMFVSDDPDEGQAPLQVFGKTSYLDPGEPAVDFTLPLLRRDPATGEYLEETFTLSDHAGKIVWFQVYGTW